MLTIGLILITVTPLVILFLVPLARRSAKRREPEPQTESWRPVVAEVVSVLNTGSRTFVLVRYPVGTMFFHRDVEYPRGGNVPKYGQRIPVRYDPINPGKVVFDRYRATEPAPRAARRVLATA
jgi:hypothetical protein